MYEYKAKVLDWIDGDTMRVKIDLGFHCEKTEKIRLARINAVELNADTGYKVRQARSARYQAELLCPLGSIVTIETSKLKKGRYDRYIAEVEIGRKNISDELLRMGVVKKYEE